MKVIDLAAPLISVVAYYFLIKYLIFVTILNEIVRTIVSFILQYKYKTKIKLVPDGTDAIWRPNRSMAVFTLRINKIITEDQLLNHFEKDILLLKESNGSGKRVYEKLEHTLVTKFGYSCWKQDNNFNIKNHCKTLENKVYYKTDLSSILQKCEEEMGGDKPQWEFLILPQYQEAAEVITSSIVLMRFHHAYMDAISSVMMGSKITSNFTYYIDPCETPKLISTWEKFVFYSKAFILFPYISLIQLFSKFRSFWPKNSFPNQSQSCNYTWTKPIELSQMREIYKTFKNASIPVIIENAFISAAKEVLPIERLPKNWFIGELAALFPYKQERLQNRFSCFSYNIDSSSENEMERLEVSGKEAKEVATGPWILITFFLLKVFGRFPTFFAHLAMMGESNTLVTSYLPSSMTRAKLFGNWDVLDAWGFPPHGNETRVFICCNMYCNSFKVMASADTSLLTENELREIVSSIPEIVCRWSAQLNEKIE
ncbi:unnamed protein product [Orchesella dallaii]|uniref:O-acyltransferase WSD1 C-terminal domain-containing protein n=1 Tax=Orchesella dallaii TaxID=48710 RepID=A0ABP1Q9P5_9HEXA